MSVSTTTTATYELLKYSRAYSQQSDPGRSQNDLEWQHFSNPIIKLTLDTKKSSEGRLEMYRLKIIWSFSSGPGSMNVDQGEVVFEDLDLVTYSTVSSFHAPQSMPLKAVYQGPVVGLRYQHPRINPPGQAAQYRRFQVAFQNEAAATAFVDSIRFICPCKANNGPPARNPRLHPTQTSAHSVSSSSTHSTLPVTHKTTLHETPSIAAFKEPLLPPSVRRSETLWPSLSTQYAWDAPSSNQTTDPALRPSAPACLPLNSDFYQGSSRSSSAVTESSVVAHDSSSDLSAPASVHMSHTARAPRTQDSIRETQAIVSALPQAQGSRSGETTKASLPAPATPTSSLPLVSRPLPGSPALMPPPPVPLQASLPGSTQMTQSPASTAASRSTETTLVDKSHTDSSCDSISASREEISASLKDSVGLYSLPKDALERLVAEVIREEGFAELMHTLDSAWKIKGLAGISTGTSS